MMNRLKISFLGIFVFLNMFCQNEQISVVSERLLQSGDYWVNRNLPGALAPYLWLDASSNVYMQKADATLVDCTGAQQQWNLFKWLDRSGNNRHFEAVSNVAQPTFKCDSNSRPSFIYDSYVEGNGVDDDMRFDFTTAPAGTIDGLSGEVNSDFTFIFVMQSLKAVPNFFDSFISSTSGISTTYPGSWQIGTSGTDISKFNLRLQTSSTTYMDYPLNAYDTNSHVVLMSRVGTTLKLMVDGQTFFNGSVSAQPKLTYFKLFRNRIANSFLQARFYEFFVFNGTLTANEEFELNQYLKSKWGI